MGKASRAKRERRFGGTSQLGNQWAPSGSLEVQMVVDGVTTSIHEVLTEAFVRRETATVLMMEAVLSEVGFSVTDLRFLAPFDDGSTKDVGIAEWAFLWGAKDCVMVLFKQAAVADRVDVCARFLEFLAPYVRDCQSSKRRTLAVEIMKHLLSFSRGEGWQERWEKTMAIAARAPRDPVSELIFELDAERLAEEEQSELDACILAPASTVAASACWL